MDSDDNYYNFYTPNIENSNSSKREKRNTYSKKHTSTEKIPSKHIESKKQVENSENIISLKQIAYHLISNFITNIDHNKYKNEIITIKGQLSQRVDEHTYKVISPDIEGRIIYIDLEGLPHRNDGPAITYKDGKLAYYFHGKLHRAQEPAVIEPNGSHIYYDHGLKNRIEGMGPTETIVHNNKVTEYKYYCEDILHRKNGPAISKSNGEYLYYNFGKLHNEDGPATHLLKLGTTDQFEDEYYINGNKLSCLQFKMLKFRNKVFKNTISDMKYSN